MNYKILILVIFTFFLYSCDQSIINQSIDKNFKIEKNIKILDLHWFITIILLISKN